MLDQKKNNLELLGDFKERTINAKSRFLVVLFFLFFALVATKKKLPLNLVLLLVLETMI